MNTKRKKIKITAEDRRDTLRLIEAVMNKDTKKAQNNLKGIINKRIGKSMKEIAKTEDLI